MRSCFQRFFFPSCWDQKRWIADPSWRTKYWPWSGVSYSNPPVTIPFQRLCLSDVEDMKQHVPEHESHTRGGSQGAGSSDTWGTDDFLGQPQWLRRWGGGATGRTKQARSSDDAHRQCNGIRVGRVPTAWAQVQVGKLIVCLQVSYQREGCQKDSQTTCTVSDQQDGLLVGVAAKLEHWLPVPLMAARDQPSW